MSKINALRIINLNYNNNAIRINDETFRLNGESTLLSLRNGGGKSVLVQMLTAPFVHKRYRDAKDRPFESYFTTNKPTFLMVEWVLDGGAGYVLTGMMVRKNQDMSEERTEELEIVNFISEYRNHCPYDIAHLSVIEKTKKELNLKGFAACKQLFESLKKDRFIQFFSYDMNQQAQSKQYFDKLLEYQINYKEWETIIKKVNLKESGLSELFADCKDEKGLVEKWFLDAVENKLNKEKNRMKEFENIVTKYVGQYKDNRSKIERRDTIRLFQKEAVEILLRAGEYEEASGEVSGCEGKIAGFIRELNRLEALAEEERGGIEERAEAIERDIRQIGYEKLSYEIHLQREQQSYHLSSRELIGFLRDGLEKECGEMIRKLQLLECARWHGETSDSHREFRLAEEKLAVLLKRQEDLAPERNRLGTTLKACYEKMWLDQKQRKAETEKAYANTSKNLELEKENADQYQKDMLAVGTAAGGLKARIADYDREEEHYNKRYGDDLKRNILGEYEPAALDLKLEQYHKEMELAKRKQVESKRRLEELSVEQKALERGMQDTRHESAVAGANKEEQERNKERFDKELEDRRVILRYLELEEGELFDLEKILSATARKLKEIAQAKRSGEKELDEMEAEYRRLTQGRVLELPKDFEEMLDRIGVNYVYGMDWLKKNGNTAAKNQEIVKNHPFIPYALILSDGELQKLAKYGDSVYTSSPIPIIRREELANAGEESGGKVISMDRLNFYILFNDNLLDEDKLKVLTAQKEGLIEKKRQVLLQKQKEYDEYFAKQEKIKNQEVTAENYEALKKEIARLALCLDEYRVRLDNQREKAAALEAEVKKLREGIEDLRISLEHGGLRHGELIQLMHRYEQYLGERKELLKLNSRLEQLGESMERSKTRQEKLAGQIKSLDEELYLLKVLIGKTEDKKALYEQFDLASANGEPEYTEEERLGMESRYEAITGKISGEQKELEDALSKAAKTHEKNRDELQHLKKKHGLTLEDYGNVLYSRSEKERIEETMNRKQKDKAMQEALWNEEDKAVALLKQKIDDCIREMQENFEKEEPVPKEQIILIEFDARTSKARQALSQEKECLDALDKKLRGYGENITALTEYNSFVPDEAMVWDVDFSAMTYRELGEFKGIMVRDYRESVGKRRDKKDALVQTLNRIVRMYEFEEDFYRKPLESLLQLADDAGQVILQLQTTLASYESLMEKLEVDISMIEKEKEKIVEILEDYIREVHQNLGRIDKNSTINIRDRQVKMLKLQLPDWEENEQLYHIRLLDFMEDVTLKGIGILERNENAAEYLGSKITTKSLYDTVVGIGNVEIRLYKVEEKREYPITWAEVGKNSGGEGFLSAFVILNSLLYYMRKDDTDIFADRKEGKVLVMDNPFAQTNAAHLLKPLMDMAKKTDTQLICLSGLGGESIYNRFENIYVLNLIAANLRGGMQYLKADHIRGSEEEQMVLSHIEVMEQMELMF